MTLSVEMIAESMQPFGARVVMQQERTFAFRRVQMLTPSPRTRSRKTCSTSASRR